ncbi:hypothetical protein ACFX10_036058 [Malus domestica]
MVVKDEWTRAAMTDDVLVVELLLQLKQAQASFDTQVGCQDATLQSDIVRFQIQWWCLASKEKRQERCRFHH